MKIRVYGERRGASRRCFQEPAASASPLTTHKFSKHVIGRLIIDQPAAGSWNMAVDAAILASLSSDDLPTLRFYGWARPTLSLGYFQHHADRTRHHESQGIEIVRRATGGGAIVHHHELTYSLTVSKTAMPTTTNSIGQQLGAHRRGAAQQLYRAVHQCMIVALATIGVHASRRGGSPSIPRDEEPFLCFQRRTEEDLLVSGYKVIGSAQRHGPSGVLQHGSLLLQSSPFAPQLPGLAELAGSTGPMATDIASEIAKTMNCTWKVSSLSKEEQRLASEIEQKRFGNPAWLFLR